MKELLVGLLVIMMALILSGLGILLLPLFLVLGIFLRLIFGLLLVILAVWLIGKLTLFLVSCLRTGETKKE